MNRTVFIPNQIYCNIVIHDTICKTFLIAILPHISHDNMQVLPPPFRFKSRHMQIRRGLDTTKKQEMDRVYLHD